MKNCTLESTIFNESKKIESPALSTQLKNECPIDQVDLLKEAKDRETVDNSRKFWSPNSTQKLREEQLKKTFK